jgi:hypothetical protein
MSKSGIVSTPSAKNLYNRSAFSISLSQAIRQESLSDIFELGFIISIFIFGLPNMGYYLGI